MNNNKTLKSLFASTPYILVTFLLIALVFRALELRLPGITRNFDEAEGQHLFNAIHPTHFKWMLELITATQQPFLDFFLRRYLWIMMFGHSELSLRIPSMIYSLSTVAVCFIGPFYYLKQKKLPYFYILSACIIIALFAINHKYEIMHSAIGRNYSFTALASTIWVSILLFYEGKYKHYFMASASFLFFNSHFFSLPLILSGYLYIIAKLLIQKKYKELLTPMVLLIIVLTVSVGINYQSFYYLYSNPAGSSSNPILQSVTLGLKRYDIFLKDYLYLFIPIPFFLLVNLIFIRREENQKLMLLLLIPLLFLIYVSKRSDYGFGMRYYSPFFGIGMGLLTLFLYNIYDLIAQLKSFIKDHKKLVFVRNSSAAILIGILLFVSDVHYLPSNLVKDRFNIKIPPKNFSKNYQIFQELKQPQVPLFIINSQSFGHEFTNYLYMRWIGTAGFNRGYDYGFELVNAHGHNMHLAINVEKGKDRLKRFIEMNPKGKIILDAKKHPFTDPSVFDYPLVAEKVKRITCCNIQVWILSNITSADQVYRIAKILKIPGRMLNQ